MLAFLLLLWVGLRGSDAVALAWSEVDWDWKEIVRVTQKCGKRVIVLIHPELLFALEAEGDGRNPQVGTQVPFALRMTFVHSNGVPMEERF